MCGVCRKGNEAVEVTARTQVRASSAARLAPVQAA